MDDHDFMKIAIDEGAQGLSEGGVPIGAALVADGKVLGSGHNRRVQQGSVIRHGETDCLENVGRLHASVYRRATMIELPRSGLDYDYIKQLPVEYEGQLLGYQDVRLILVEGKVLLATFALRQTEDVMAEQLKAHLRRLGLKLGLLANFYGTRLTITPVRVR